MTSTHHLNGQAPGMFGQVGRWLTIAAMSVVAAFMLFFSAAFALVLIGTISVLVLITVVVLGLVSLLSLPSMR